ncbi:hypothetical protein [Hymenobacter psychrophilus]|uniref:Uncharacterized protein n=1 Tax=Hymenobacter psychrophilus TaxID=651662 RepID=A0A1H3D2T3_9BACT|nr:hypothetical protein [Hymenobacter psychrophilus]SDX60697.1 hypothetical protein SAMN04488069_102203 [Hymenobacter psychrophilus]
MPNIYQQCSRCIMDTTVPGITFDAQGECNFCALHDKMDRACPLGKLASGTCRTWRPI